MNQAPAASQAISGTARTIRDLLATKRYSIDFYQRDYQWQRRHIAQLLDDLCDAFIEKYNATDERMAVERYRRYFLGSIVIAERDGKRFIIDGQQRLTTITLLLIHLYHRLVSAHDKAQLAGLIFSVHYGKQSFKLDIPQRTPCMKALFEGSEYVDPGTDASVTNLLARYSDIADDFPVELDGDALPFFADWLVENVHLIEITAYSDQDAYTIFETMNDRGMSLKPIDMLKGYLLAEITDTAARTHAEGLWRSRVLALSGGTTGEGTRDDDANAVKAWLRAQYADTVRNAGGAHRAADFDLIGTEFHQWVRENSDRLDLKGPASFEAFISKDFVFFTAQYERLRSCSRTVTPGLEPVFFNANHSFTLQYPVILAAITKGDDGPTIRQKIHIVSSYIDILLHRRIWDFKNIMQTRMHEQMFSLAKEVRHLPVPQLARLLFDRLAESPAFEDADPFRLHGTNRKRVHAILARITDYVETESGNASHIGEYLAGGPKGYDVEHIWADKYSRHRSEFGSEQDFQSYRNMLGGLLIVPRKFNQSYGDLTYGAKLPHYGVQNLLARSLTCGAYDHNPGVLAFVKRTGLKFRSLDTFNREALVERHSLYRDLVRLVWSPNRLLEPVTS